MLRSKGIFRSNIEANTLYTDLYRRWELEQHCQIRTLTGSVKSYISYIIMSASPLAVLLRWSEPKGLNKLIDNLNMFNQLNSTKSIIWSYRHQGRSNSQLKI